MLNTEQLVAIDSYPDPDGAVSLVIQFSGGGVSENFRSTMNVDEVAYQLRVLADRIQQAVKTRELAQMVKTKCAI